MLPGHNLDAAIAVAERWWRTERKAFRIASALGTATGCRSTCCASFVCSYA